MIYCLLQKACEAEVKKLTTKELQKQEKQIAHHAVQMVYIYIYICKSQCMQLVFYVYLKGEFFWAH